MNIQTKTFRVINLMINRVVNQPLKQIFNQGKINKRDTKIGKFFSLIILIMGVTACQSTKPPVTSGIGVESITNEIPPATYLRVDNIALAEKLTVSDVKHRKINDFLEVNIELSSQDEKSLKLQYHFNWFDENGFSVEKGKSPWIPIELHGLQSTILRGVSPSTKATSFNVYVRRVAKN